MERTVATKPWIYIVVVDEHQPHSTTSYSSCFSYKEQACRQSHGLCQQKQSISHRERGYERRPENISRYEFFVRPTERSMARLAKTRHSHAG